MNDKTATLLKASEVGAVMASFQVGSKNKEKVDHEAVIAIEFILKQNSFPGKVIIGEGDLEDAPRLHVGQEFGKEVLFDIAVDPVEGTTPVAHNNPGAITSIAVARRSSMAEIPEMYMEKLFVSPELKEVADLKKGIEWNIKKFKEVSKHRELKAIILNKKRHRTIIKFMRDHKIHVEPINDGDVMGAIDVVNGEADFVYGIGGSPEGALMASLAIASDSKMEWALKKLETVGSSKTNNEDDFKREKELVKASKFDYDKVYSCKDLINDNETVFVSTAITAGNSLHGVKYKNNKYRTMSILATKGVVRNIQSTYHLKKIIKYEKELGFLKK